MKLSLGCYPRCEQRCYLTATQKLGLKELLLVEERLRHPEYPDAVYGLQGMLTAHQILQEKESVGILIGGLSEAVWNQRRKKSELDKHKDVDVMVLDKNFILSKEFEGGVDWWLPQYGMITINSDYSRMENIHKTWWKNGTGVILSFGANKWCQLNPGLYILDSEWVVDMREYEADANVDHGRVDVEFDDNVFKKFRAKVKEKVKTRIPEFMIKLFAGYILSPHYGQYYERINPITLERFDLKTLRGIHSLEDVIAEKT